MRIKINKILCPTDFSEPAENALRYAFTLADKYGAKVYVQHVLEPITPVPGIDMGPSFNYDERPHTFQQVEEPLQEMLAKIDKASVPYETVVSRGAPFLEIIRTAKENEVDMIVIATHGRTGLAHILLGSTAEKVVRKATCPVLTVKQTEHEFVTT